MATTAMGRYAGDALSAFRTAVDALGEDRPDLDQALPDTGPAMRGDPDQLVEVFENLVDNAIKYGRRKGQARIAVARPAGRAATCRLQSAETGRQPVSCDRWSLA